jgi:ribosome-binding factor A
MAAPRRIQRINSLLKEVISDVIRLDLKNYKVPDLLTVTDVSTSNDLQHAKVFVSLINGNKEDKDSLVKELQKCSSVIARMSSRKVSMRYFPNLIFKVDNTLDDYMNINDILAKIPKSSLELDSEQDADDDFVDEDDDFVDEDDDDFEDEAFLDEDEDADEDDFEDEDEDADDFDDEDEDADDFDDEEDDIYDEDDDE